MRVAFFPEPDERCERLALGKPLGQLHKYFGMLLGNP